jgi:hypothetical protein
MSSINVCNRLGVVLGILLVSSSQAPSIVETGEPSQLTLQLDTGKTRFVMYEPVILTYSLVNPTDMVIESNAKMTFGTGYLKLFIARAGESPREFHSGIIGETTRTGKLVHPRHSILVADVRVFFNDLADDLAFPRTGRYKIQAKMYLGNFPDPLFVEAAPAEIEVVGPRNVDTEVIEALGSETNLVVLLRDGPEAYCKIDGSPRCWEKLMSLRERFPDSSYMPAMTFVLAGTLGLKGMGAGPRHDLQAVILEDFLKRWPNHPLGARVTTALVGAFRDLGKMREAAEWVDRFEQKYPGRSSPRRLIEKSSGGS